MPVDNDDSTKSQQSQLISFVGPMDVFIGEFFLATSRRQAVRNSESSNPVGEDKCSQKTKKS